MIRCPLASLIDHSFDVPVQRVLKHEWPYSRLMKQVSQMIFETSVYNVLNCSAYLGRGQSVQTSWRFSLKYIEPGVIARTRIAGFVVEFDDKLLDGCEISRLFGHHVERVFGQVQQRICQPRARFSGLTCVHFVLSDKGRRCVRSCQCV